MSPTHKPSAFERAQEYWSDRHAECTRGAEIAEYRLDLLQPETQLQLFTVQAIKNVIPFPYRERPQDIVA